MRARRRKTRDRTLQAILHGLKGDSGVAEPAIASGTERKWKSFSRFFRKKRESKWKEPRQKNARPKGREWSAPLKRTHGLKGKDHIKGIQALIRGLINPGECYRWEGD